MTEFDRALGMFQRTGDIRYWELMDELYERTETTKKNPGLKHKSGKQEKSDKPVTAQPTGDRLPLYPGCYRRFPSCKD